MKEKSGNIWSEIGQVNALCVLTNGIVKRDGSLVMGAGIALQAKQRYPGIQYSLGMMIKKYGNVPIIAKEVDHTYIMTFPTKNHYKDKADTFLIIRSARSLKDIADRLQWTKIAIPRPGCGLGGLKWNDLKKALSNYFDDRFEVWSY